MRLGRLTSRKADGLLNQLEAWSVAAPRMRQTMADHSEHSICVNDSLTKPKLIRFRLHIILGALALVGSAERDPLLAQNGSCELRLESLQETGEHCGESILAVVHAEQDANVHRGVAAALEAMKPGKGIGPKVSVRQCVYPDEDYRTAANYLEQIAKNPCVSAVIGPTDTDAFTDAQQILKDEESHAPVVSPTVQGVEDVRGEHDDQFYTFAVTSAKRAAAIRRLVTNHGIGSIGLIIADSAFARMTANSFLVTEDDQATPSGLAMYSQMVDKGAPADQLQDAVQELVAEIGVESVAAFIPPNRLPVVVDALSKRAKPYRKPLLFTTVDPRGVAKPIGGVLFASVLGADHNQCPDRQNEAPGSGACDELFSVSYDLATQVLQVLADREVTVARRLLRTMLAEEARKFKTGEGEIGSTLKMLYMDTDLQVREPDDNDELWSEVGFVEKVVGLFKSRESRSDLATSLMLLAASVLGFSAVYLIRERQMPFSTVISYRGFWFLAVGNLVLVASLYLWAWQSEIVALDDHGWVLTAAIAGPLAASSRYLESRGSLLLGLERVYEAFLEWVDKAIIVERDDGSDISRTVTILAYCNGLDALEDELQRLYGKTRNAKRAKELFRRYREDIRELEDELHRREFCARQILDHYSLAELLAYNENLVPQVYRQHSWLDPLRLISDCERWCRNVDQREKKLSDYLNRQIEGLPDARRRDTVRGRFELEIAEREGSAAYLRAKFLVARFLVEPAALVEQGLLAPDYLQRGSEG